MKTELAAMDIHFLIEEFKPIIGGKIDQIYQDGREEFIFQIHLTGVGKKTLRIVPGKLIYLASAKGKMPESPPGFCLYLRKYLRGARVRDIRQLGFERIIEISLDAKDKSYKLVIELFSKGNLVVCDKDYMIFSAMESQVWSDRTIRAKQTYTHPTREFDLLKLTRQELSGFLEKSDKESAVKSLAADLGLGGVYAEEVCLDAKIDKSIPPKKLVDKQIAALFDSIKRLRESKPAPQQVFKPVDKEGEHAEELIDIVPIELQTYSSMTSRPFNSFNEALDAHFTPKHEAQQKAVVTKEVTVKLDKMGVMISEQQRRTAGLERSIIENQRKGELLFEHYQEVTELLQKIKELKKTHPWPEVKALLKDEKILKNIDEKKGEVTIDLV